MNKNILFIIDELEFKYFELNKLVTNFWLIAEFLKRRYRVFVGVKSDLFLRGNIPYCKSYEAFLENDLVKSDKFSNLEISYFSAVFVRPDPPVDVDYINALHILDFADKKKTLFINSPDGILKCNEKLYINEFPNLAPVNIVSSDMKLIKEFLFEHNEVIIKPLNLCFSSGVFYLNREDKNINTIIKTATNNGKTAVMVQEFLPKISNGDKRLIFVCGEILEYCVTKKGSDNDFKFNNHCDENLVLGVLTPEQKNFQHVISEKLLHDGIYLAGLDVIDDKIIEINVTSPCFFIKEINKIFDVKLEKIIGDRLEKTINDTYCGQLSKVM